MRNTNEDDLPEDPITGPVPKKKKRGFACMDPARQRAIAGQGGKAAHAKGTAHRFTPEEARAAGRKGAVQSLISKRGKKNAASETGGGI